MRYAGIAWVGLLLAGIGPGSANLRADQLDEVKLRGTLIWGGDEEGGAPFVFRDKENTDKLIGFEVELADMIAKELGVKAQFQQGQWQNLPQLVDQATIDVVLNGYELDPERQANYLCSRPYYVYGLQLLVDRNGPIQSWEDFKKPGKKFRIGVLEASACDRHLSQEEFKNNIEVVRYAGPSECFSQVKSGQVDGTLQDDCIAVQFADDFPELRFVERPVAPGYYVAIMTLGETRLEAAINEALGKIISDGRIKELYDKWDMSGRSQMLALRNVSEIKPAPRRTIWEVLHDSIGLLLQGAGMTLLLSFAAMPLAILAGILIAIGRLYGPAWVRLPLTLFVEVVRGTPLMLQLFFIFFLLPELGIQLDALVAAIAGLAINYSAYEAEIYRAGLQAIPHGQLEVALSLGLSKGQAIRKVILPQAIRIVIPPVTNDFIALFKDTSVCSVVTIVELTKQYNILARNNPGSLVYLAAITATLYLLMSYPLSLFARWNEARLATAKPRAH